MNQVAYDNKVAADGCSSNVSVTHLINIKVNISIESDPLSADTLY